MIAELEAKRTRLAAVERDLAELGMRQKFDEAREVQQRIGVLERERGELVETLPAPAPPPPATPAPRMVPRRHLMHQRSRPLRR